MPSATVAGSRDCGSAPRTRVDEGATVQQQRRARRRPDLAIGVGAARRADAQDDAVQRQPPQPARRLDDARIPEELGEEAPDGGRGRGVGRAEIHQQHAQARGAAVLVIAVRPR